MQRCNITLKSSCVPGSILIKNEEEEPCLFIMNTVVIGTLHFEIISLWFSGRPSLSTRVRTKILFSFLRLDFASLMYLHPNVLMILRMGHTHKAGRLSERVFRNPRWQWNHYSLTAEQDVIAPPGSHSGPDWKQGKKLGARVFLFIAISGETRTGPGKQST